MTVDVRIAERDGSFVASFTDQGRCMANVSDVTWILNQPGTARVTVPLHHPTTTELHMVGREIQIWRDDQIVWWGVPLSGRVQGATLMVECVGLLWYFARSLFGPITVQLLANPNFEADLTGWTAMGPTATHQADTVRLLGPGTAQLVETTGGEDSYLAQGFTVNTGEIGLYIEVRALVWIDPAVEFEPAFEERGIAVLAANSAQGFAWEPLNNWTPKGVPQVMTTGINLLPDLTDEPVEVRLYSPKGLVRWGACVATVMESVSSEPSGTDATEMMRRVASYAVGKADLEIATPAQDPAGVGEITAYQFMDLGQVLQALSTYPDRGLADFDVTFDETSKTFETWAPQRGSDLSGDVVFTVPGDGSVIEFGWQADGGQVATQVVRRFPGSGPSRPLGVATDTSGFDGLLLADVGDLPPEITVDGADQYAAQILARRKELVTIPDFTVPAGEVFGEFWLGDTVGVNVDLGAVVESEPRRVVRLGWDPVTDTVAVGVSQ